MRPDLQRRFLKVGRNIDRMDRLRSFLEDRTETSPRSLLATAALGVVEVIAAAGSSSEDESALHRAYEEVFAALTESEAVTELLSGQKVASFGVSERALSLLKGLRSDAAALSRSTP